MRADDVLVEAALAKHGASITRHDLAVALQWDLARVERVCARLRADWPGPACACPEAAGTATASRQGQGCWGLRRQDGCGWPMVAECRCRPGLRHS